MRYTNLYFTYLLSYLLPLHYYCYMFSLAAVYFGSAFTNDYVGPLYVGPKSTLAASHAALGESRERQTDRRTDAKPLHYAFR